MTANKKKKLPGNKKKLPEDEMDGLVIADADDDSAWGEPVPAPASKSPRPVWIAEAKPSAVGNRSRPC